MGSVLEQSADFIAQCVRGKLNILISGGTGTGKTTLLNAVSAYVPPGERVVTVEDAAELRLLQRHVVSLESRPPNIEGEGEVRIRDLVRNALRMRPDRIIVGEVRGAETLDMLQAMNTGHDGSLTTIHANSARDALHRLEMLVLMAGVELPIKAIREQIAGGFDLLVHISRLVDGSRRVTQITEISGMEGDVITLQDLFVAARPITAGRLAAARSTRVDTTTAWIPVEAHGERRRPSPERLAGGHEAGRLALSLAVAAAAGTPEPRGLRGDPACRLRRLPARSSDRDCSGRVRAQPARERAQGALRSARPLGSAEALLLAVDNSSSMRGRPLREAKRAAREFLVGGQHASSTGLLAFGHEALTLTRLRERRGRAEPHAAGAGCRNRHGTLRRNRLFELPTRADVDRDAHPRPAH